VAEFDEDSAEIDAGQVEGASRMAELKRKEEPKGGKHNAAGRDMVARVGCVSNMDVSFPKQKACHWQAFLFFYSISSEYHMERIKLPNILGGIKM
jgi:hypothetical protein